MSARSCHSCGNEIPPGTLPFFEIRGYEKPRQQGGTNHVVRRERTGRFLCGSCMSRLEAGIAEGQEQLA